MIATKNIIRRTSTLLATRFASNAVISNQVKILCTTSHISSYPVTKFSRQFSTAPFECVNIQDTQDFKEKVLDSSIPVIVDFHATWCGPCKVLGPRLEAIISQKEGKVILAKVDIDEISDLAIEYGVKSVPTVFGVDKGKVLDSFIGVKEDDQIEQFVDKLIL